MKPKVKDEASILMRQHLKELSPTIFTGAEYKFFDHRRWRFDWIVYDGRAPEKKIAVEIEGGAFTQGRHTRGVGFIKDMEKYNHAALLGWRVLRFTPDQVLKGEAIAFIRRVLES
jgi:very-short-patch-repair endonuclease